MPSAADSILARAKEEDRARLRLYIGAAPGVGKTYRMLEDAHELRRQGIDVVIGFVEAHGRADTLARLGDLERVPTREIEYRGVKLTEMDVAAVKARMPVPVILTRDYADHRSKYEALGATVAVERLVTIKQREVPQERRSDVAAFLRVLSTDGHDDAVYELSGDVAWDFDDLSAVFGHVLGREVTYQRLTPEQHLAAAPG